MNTIVAFFQRFHTIHVLLGDRCLIETNIYPIVSVRQTERTNEDCKDQQDSHWCWARGNHHLLVGLQFQPSFHRCHKRNPLWINNA